VIALALAAVALAGCPHDSQLSGRISYLRGTTQHVVTLATCADRRVGAPAGNTLEGVTTSGARARTQWIRVGDKLVFSHRENGPVVLLSMSPDRRWLVFAIDSFGSASIMADGLQLQLVSTRGGAVHPLGLSLAYRDYLSWCGNGLVYVRGGDRIATDVKQLVYAQPPTWRGRDLWPDAHRSFASPACAPSNDGVAVLTQRSSTNARFFSTRWQLWSVTLGGARSPLDVPPAGWADESPAWSPTGDMVAFVRERAGKGTLVVMHNGIEPIASLGYSLGFYGHHTWELRWER
jgi:dipeptidyl aminopeptidase/acylaminoacyl peptidase